MRERARYHKLFLLQLDPLILQNLYALPDVLQIVFPLVHLVLVIVLRSVHLVRKFFRLFRQYKLVLDVEIINVEVSSLRDLPDNVDPDLQVLYEVKFVGYRCSGPFLATRAA
jgi:hypothetical protein